MNGAASYFKELDRESIILEDQLKNGSLAEADYKTLIFDLIVEQKKYCGIF